MSNTRGGEILLHTQSKGTAHVSAAHGTRLAGTTTHLLGAGRVGAARPRIAAAGDRAAANKAG